MEQALHEMVTKRYKTEYETTLQATRCVTFFGTPHLGMSIDFLVPITEGRLHESSRRTLEDIRSNSEMLKMLRDTLSSLQKSITFITCEEQRMTAAQVRIQLVNYLAMNISPMMLTKPRTPEVSLPETCTKLWTRIQRD